eukprot:TRINITY_DN2876_c0_g1_i1.p1 TRINITY_DN2876_c0_g1~~TRINITY_DN2876_c0_g1_i1.p1  ORF type:complete len:220 (+),score=53.73 TRINITY_DN2876_c0_g1_i1:52-660(+)
MKHLLLLCSVLVLTIAQPPIPTTYPGHVTGNANGNVVFEFFFDHLCPDSAASWPVIKQVIQAYPNIKFILHVFPLPYHRNAFYAAQAGLVIENSLGSDGFWKYVDAVFNNQPDYYNDATANVTGNGVIGMYSGLAQSIGVPVNSFVAGMTYGDNFDAQARINWKYGTTRGVYGTPIFFVNGVFVTDNAYWTFSQWQNVLNNL